MRPTLLALLGCVLALPALADEEGTNTDHTVVSPGGHCAARSVPSHLHDPPGGPRQEGRTEVVRMIGGRETLVAGHDWYARRLFVLCGPGAGDDVYVVRVGPWPRGRRPLPSHLALGFYRNGRMLKEYSTWGIAGGQEADPQAVRASGTHYDIFAADAGPTLLAAAQARAEAPGRIAPAGAGNDWVIKTVTLDGRVLYFEAETGRLR